MGVAWEEKSRSMDRQMACGRVLACFRQPLLCTESHPGG
jgi:hypothetical protein